MYVVVLEVLNMYKSSGNVPGEVLRFLVAHRINGISFISCEKEELYASLKIV